MKIVAISDTHGVDFLSLIPDCDLLLLAGDISPFQDDHSYYSQRMWFQGDFVQQLKQLKNKAKNIVFIAGNHDSYLGAKHMSGDDDIVRMDLPDGVHYLCDSWCRIDGIKIYGIPWVNLPAWAEAGPPVWNFAGGDDHLKDRCSLIPDDVDIILSHGPAFGFCDVILDDNLNAQNRVMWGSNPDSLGSKALRLRILDGLKPKYVISGHIHSADHKYQICQPVVGQHKIKFACVSVLNEYYEMGDYKPLIIDWK